ncbi:MAG: hypothetical protein IT385_27545 [Deltaproteobacteria bacterium]|nr:hypothetical protein [Deltaproteobacteria bacterium]
MSAARNVLFMWVAAAAFGAAACAEDPGRSRRLGQTCAEDGDCVDGICGGGICLDPASDDDGDGLTNALEVALGTSPVDVDTDDDGVPDPDELEASLTTRDGDGDGTPDALESLVADADGDCLPDQLDPSDDTIDSDLAGLVPIVCPDRGVCAGSPARVVTCPAGAGSATCDVSAVAGHEADEATCDGLDNDCDGATDEGHPDGDDDASADCVDADDDGDGVADTIDVCPAAFDPAQGDGDDDARGDACDPPAAAQIEALAPGADATRVTASGTCERGTEVHVFAAAADPCAAAEPSAIATCDADGAWSTTLVVAADPTRLATRAENAAGLVGACVVSALEHRSQVGEAAPPLPIASPFSPASPSASAAVEVVGCAPSGEAGAAVTVFEGSCVGSGVAATARAAACPEGHAGFGAAVTAPTNATTSYYARRVDAEARRSACVWLGAFTHDGVAPAAPMLIDVEPPSPSASSAVTITLDADGEVALAWLGPGCEGEPDLTLADGATVVLVPEDATTEIHARTIDAAGNTSACTRLLAYTHDARAPVAPAPHPEPFTPASPSPDDTPELTACAELGQAVAVFATPGCAGAPMTTATTQVADARCASGRATRVTITALDGGVTTIAGRTTSATGVVSSCVHLGTYEHDDVPPDAPTFTSAEPPSPSSDVTPVLAGGAEAGSRVELFDDEDCQGAPVLEAIATEAGWRQAATLAGDRATLLYGRALDRAGNGSECAQVTSYTTDLTAPDAPTGASGKFTETFPDYVVRGCAEAFAEVAVFTDPACADERARASATLDEAGCTTPKRQFDATLTVPADEAVDVYVRAFDAAGNASACVHSRSILWDTVAPAAPTDLSTRATTWTDGALGFVVGGVIDEADGTNVRIVEVSSGFAGGPCTGTELGVGSVLEGRFEVAASAPLDVELTIAARVIDPAGNAGPCSAGVDVLRTSSATGLAPDPADTSRWAVPEGGPILWHYPDGTLASWSTIDALDDTATAVTFEGMLVTGAFEGGPRATHTMLSYALAPGEDVVLRHDELTESPRSKFGSIGAFNVQVVLPPFAGATYYDVILSCGFTRRFTTSSPSWLLYDWCTPSYVCHATDPTGQTCLDFDFDMRITAVARDAGGAPLAYATGPTETLTEQVTSPSYDYSAASWLTDFGALDVTLVGSGELPAPVSVRSHFEMDSSWTTLEGATAFLLEGQQYALVTKIVPGLPWRLTLHQFQVAGSYDAYGFVTSREITRMVAGAETTTVVADMQREAPPYIVPAAAVDASDPARPIVHARTMGATGAQAFYTVAMLRSTDGEHLEWRRVAAAGDDIVFAYPEVPPELPWLAADGYLPIDDVFAVTLHTLELIGLADWPAFRARFGPTMLELHDERTLFDMPSGLPEGTLWKHARCCYED